MNQQSTEKRVSGENSGHGRVWLAWAVVFGALVATLATGISAKMDVEADAKKDFNFACNEIQLRIEARMQAHAQILRSAAAVFDASDTVTREQWQTFTMHQKVEQYLPGIQGIGFSLAIPREQLAQHIQEIRGQGFSDYTVRPEGDRENYTSIVYLEPFSGRNLRAFGYDMFSESVRRKAMEQARDSDKASLSGKVTLLQETDQDVQAGTLMYVPVFRRGMATDTVAHRQAALYGWVYSPYRMNDLMANILTGWDSEAGKYIRLQIFDNEQLSADSLMYDSKPNGKREPDNASGFKLEVPLDFNNRPWYLRFSQTGEHLTYGRVYGILFGGTVISLLLFGLILSILRTRFKAQQLADHLTADLRNSEEKYRIVFNNDIYAICIFDLETLRLIDVNDAYCRVYGYSRDELVSGMTIHDITAEHHQSDAATKQAISNGTIFIPLRYHRKKDGTVFPVEIIGGPYVWQGRKVMFGLANDITERKKAEELLWEQHWRSANIIEGTRVGTWEWNIPTGETIFNDRWAEIVGYTLDELTPISIKTWEKLCHPDDLKRSADLLEKHFAGELPYYNCECRIKHKDGRWIWVLDRGRIITRTKEGKPLLMYGTHADISERKLAEEKLAESEAKYRSAYSFIRLLCDNVPDMIWAKDLEKRYVFANKAVCRDLLNAVDTDEPIGKVDMFFAERERARHINDPEWHTFGEICQDTDIITMETGAQQQFDEYGNVQGKFLFLDVYKAPFLDDNGKMIGTVGSARDVTKAKDLEKKLKESQAYLTNAAKAANFGVFSYDYKSGQAYCSPELFALLGFPTGAYLETDKDLILNALHPEDKPGFLAKMKAANDPCGFGMLEHVCRIIRPDGQVRWLRVTGQTTFSGSQPSDHPLRADGIIQDITDGKRLSEEQKKFERQQQLLQKAESLKTMAGAIAHHFNNQLGAVMGNLEMAIDDLPSGSSSATLNEAMKASHRAAEVSSLMLTYLGQSVVKQAPLDLSKTCRQSLPLLEAIVPPKILFTTDLPIPGPVIRANADQILQVLTNLVTNASEAEDKNKGAIDLTVRIGSPADISVIHRFPVDWKPQDLTYACITVTDSGCGITDDDLGKIFDPFYSSKFPGRGLGLAVLLGIVEAHDGVVTVESEQGLGSTFRVFLPMAAEQTLPQLDQTAPTSVIEGNQTVLLIEDEEILRNMAETMLMRLGFKVFTAKDGIEALEIFQEHPDEIRVVVTDLSMPRMDGWETLSALRRIRPDIPVVMVSGHDESKVITDDHTELPQVFLHKPYQKAELKEALAKAIKR